MRINRFKKFTIPIHIEEKVEEEKIEEVPKVIVYDSMRSRRDKHNEAIEKFKKERCSFEEGVYCDLPTLRKKYREFLKYNGYLVYIDCLFKLYPNEFFDIDDRIFFRNLKFCKSCKERHEKGCCDEYGHRHRYNKDYLINLKVI
jgi:hypothetical protein